MRRVVIALLAAGALWGCNEGEKKQAAAPPAPQVEVRTLQPTKVDDSADYVGQLISRESVVVYPQVTGYVRAIKVRPGDKVTAGQLLIEIDQRQQAAELNRGRAAREQALAQLEYARRTAERAEQLLKEGIMSRQDYDQAISQARVAEANARSAEAQVRSQEVQIAFHEVRAPFDGTVGDVPVKVGDLVTAQTQLTSVNQSGALELSVKIPFDRARQVEVGSTPVQLIGEQGKVVMSAPAFFIAPTPDPQTQLVEIKAAFANGHGLRPGQRVRARIIYQRVEALTLPSYAVFSQSGQAFAYAVLDGEQGPKVERKPITVEALQREGWVVTGGLTAGDKVALSRIQQLRDGQVITPVEEGKGGSGPSAQGR